MEKNRRRIQRIYAVLSNAKVAVSIVTVGVLFLAIVDFCWLWSLFMNCLDCMTEVAQSGMAGIKISRVVLAFLSVDLLFVCIFSLIVHLILRRVDTQNFSVVRLCVVVSVNIIAASLCALMAVLWRITMLFGALVCLFVAYIAIVAVVLFFAVWRGFQRKKET